MVKKLFFCILISEKVVGSGVGSEEGSGSISQRYGSGSAPKCHGSPTLVLLLDMKGLVLSPQISNEGGKGTVFRDRYLIERLFHEPFFSGTLM
jgi:hypothetical protein